MNAPEKKPGTSTDEAVGVAALHISMLVNAFTQFEKDYYRMPLPISAVKGYDCYSTTAAEEGLVAVLKGLDQEQNSRRVDYLAGLPKAVLRGEKLAGGWYPWTPEALAIFDPWGNYYHVGIDSCGDGELEDPEAAGTSPGESGRRPQIQKCILIWSAGPDGDPDTWADNVCSWR
jgi:hypothetical protein